MSHRKIIEGLEDLLKQRLENFKDHKQNWQKKIILAFKRILHPYNLLALAYSAFLIYNIDVLQGRGQGLTDVKFDIKDSDGLITQHIITVIVVLLLVILDVYLRI